ncbi:septation protein A [Aureimonas sp. Leaf460]|uniref:septation protein A n=2 Tax=unclassified Aureimonas TaxID=2615206 RepID=UPI0006F443B5|nr:MULTISPECIES: septation protein A [unclassified Aureimonas]KQT65920.1 septation protein A [Aureimonas sp. Leaf427]KQT73279.1 septation protein A [Aureimonas sp. Leaf460]
MPETILEPGPNAPGPARAKKDMNPLLKFALELGPLVVFFFANSRGEWLAQRFPTLAELGGPLFIATALFMAATVLALAVSWSLTRTLPIMPLVSGLFVVVFGFLTLWLQNETFIKMKPTIVNSLFAVILLGGLFFGKALLGYVFEQAFKLDDAGWRKLTLRWGLFFLVMAAMNEVVWRNFSTDFWAGFKVWATMPITMIFMIFQIPLLKRHATEPLIKDYTGGKP